MRVRHLTQFTCLLAAALLVAAGLGLRLHAADQPYAPVAEIHVGGPATFDYLVADAAGQRLYLTHGTEVVVIDTAKNTVVGKIPAGPRVHGIAIAPGNRGFVTNGGENTVSIVDLTTLQVSSKVPTGANPDAILYESKGKEVYALNHTGKSATVIEAGTGKVVATIPLSGTAETGQADPSQGRVFVNIEDKNVVDVIDTVTRKLIASWPVAPAEEPTGMAIDTATHRLFVGGGKFQVMMDANTGKVLASVPICNGTDATSFDPETKMSFSSCSDGNITAARMDGDKLTVAQTIKTVRGARTMAVDTATHKLYVAGQKPAVPDSFFVMVLGTAK